VTAALTGAWRLARLDPQGMRWFDLSERGFWRSFQAAVIAAPAYLLLLLLYQAHAPESTDATSSLTLQMLLFAVQWATFPLLLIPIC